MLTKTVYYDNNGVIHFEVEQPMGNSTQISISTNGLVELEVPLHVSANTHYVVNGELVEFPVDLGLLPLP